VINELKINYILRVKYVVVKSMLNIIVQKKEKLPGKEQIKNEL